MVYIQRFEKTRSRKYSYANCSTLPDEAVDIPDISLLGAVCMFSSNERCFSSVANRCLHRGARRLRTNQNTATPHSLPPSRSPPSFATRALPFLCMCVYWCVPWYIRRSVKG